MMMLISIRILSICLFLSIILFRSATCNDVNSIDVHHRSSSLKRVYSCYQCNSAVVGQEKCESSDRKVLEIFRKECHLLTSGFFFKDSYAIGCRKSIQQIQRGESMSRECAYSGINWDGKVYAGTKAVRLIHYQCDTENCNYATRSTTPTHYHLLIILIFIIQRFLF